MTIPFAAAPLSSADRREGFLVGAVVGARLAARTVACRDAAAVLDLLDGGDVIPLPAPAGRRPAATALADALLEEFTHGGVDLRRLASRWVAWWREDGFEAGPLLGAALSQIAEFDAPAATLPAPGSAPMVAALPAALASATPATMVSGAFHVARLLDPSEEAGLCAVAAVLTGSRLLEGSRDFIPDVLALLRTNRASEELVEAVRVVPRDPRTSPPFPEGEEPAPVATLSWLLWQLQHRPRGVELLREVTLRGGVSPFVGALLGALVGARDGLVGWPTAWVAGAGEEVVLRRALVHRWGE
jgi:ADP-ribosylglycohydrolase